MGSEHSRQHVSAEDNGIRWSDVERYRENPAQQSAEITNYFNAINDVRRNARIEASRQGITNNDDIIAFENRAMHHLDDMGVDGNGGYGTIPFTLDRYTSDIRPVAPTMRSAATRVARLVHSESPHHYLSRGDSYRLQSPREYRYVNVPHIASPRDVVSASTMNRVRGLDDEEW